MTFPDGDDKEPLDLEQQQIVPDPPEDDEPGEEGEAFVGFADEIDEEAEQTPLVQKLRAQIRKLSRKPTHSNDDDDPEPAVSEEPGSIEDFDYDSDRQRAAWRKHKEELAVHAEWKGRQGAKSAQREAEQVQTVKRIQQQAKQLGVIDFDAREERVREALSTVQLKAIVAYAENPAAMIAALGGSQTKLDEMSSVDDPAMFMKMLGRIERDLKVGKRKAPEPEARVHGGNAALTDSTDKELGRLEREADKTGDRSKVIAYKREMRRAAA